MNWVKEWIIEILNNRRYLKIIEERPKINSVVVCCIECGQNILMSDEEYKTKPSLCGRCLYEWERK